MAETFNKEKLSGVVKVVTEISVTKLCSVGTDRERHCAAKGFIGAALNSRRQRPGQYLQYITYSTYSTVLTVQYPQHSRVQYPQYSTYSTVPRVPTAH